MASLEEQRAAGEETLRRLEIEDRARYAAEAEAVLPHLRAQAVEARSQGRFELALAIENAEECMTAVVVAVQNDPLK